MPSICYHKMKTVKKYLKITEVTDYFTTIPMQISVDKIGHFFLACLACNAMVALVPFHWLHSSTQTVKDRVPM